MRRSIIVAVITNRTGQRMGLRWGRASGSLIPKRLQYITYLPKYIGERAYWFCAGGVYQSLA